ncbi:uncharacterized protein [Oscarella lobularis]|uniref:uncharacterized protein n=1 Tax=Oscarella lobularis TaxID=121494 RepID=UPI0033138D9E
MSAMIAFFVRRRLRGGRERHLPRGGTFDNQNGRGFRRLPKLPAILREGSRPEATKPAQRDRTPIVAPRRAMTCSNGIAQRGASARRKATAVPLQSRANRPIFGPRDIHEDGHGNICRH